MRRGDGGDSGANVDGSADSTAAVVAAVESVLRRSPAPARGAANAGSGASDEHRQPGVTRTSRSL